MAIEQQSLKIAFGSCALMAIFAGIGNFWLPAGSALTSILQFMVAGILYIEAHLNGLFNKRPKGTTILAAILAGVLVLQAVLNLPFLGLSNEMLTSIANYSIIVGGLLIGLELFNIDIN